MIWIALGFLVLGVLVGGAGMRKLGRMAGGAWRPGAAMLALLCFVAAAYFGVREAIGPAVILGLVGISLSMTARRLRTGRPGPRGAAGGPPARRGGMTAEEARSILGVGPEATPDEVQSAYLRLIRRAHPDQGGTSGLAAQLNAARDALLGKK
jgi:hypothetical protein